VTATPQQYAATFNLTNDGQAVFEDLAKLFGRAPFVAGQPDVTAFNCGAKAVIEHIAAQMDKASPAPRRRDNRSNNE
jgi:hypothetical protein